MPVFFKKSNHVLIQTDSYEDWSGFFHCCDGYLLQEDFDRLYDFLKEDVRTIVLEKGYHDADYRNTFYNFFLINSQVTPERPFEPTSFREKYLLKCFLSLIDIKSTTSGFPS